MRWYTAPLSGRFDHRVVCHPRGLGMVSRTQENRSPQSLHVELYRPAVNEPAVSGCHCHPGCADRKRTRASHICSRRPRTGATLVGKCPSSSHQGNFGDDGGAVGGGRPVHWLIQLVAHPHWRRRLATYLLRLVTAPTEQRGSGVPFAGLCGCGGIRADSQTGRRRLNLPHGKEGAGTMLFRRGGVAQPGRALRSQRRGHGFKSRHLHPGKRYYPGHRWAETGGEYPGSCSRLGSL